MFVIQLKKQHLLGYRLNKYLVKWIEQYLFFPTTFQRLIGILFFPFTVLYCIVTAYKRISKKPIYYGIPVISVGNLLVGGTGKTPVTIELAKTINDVAIILRGYGRESKGLFVVSNKGKILEDVITSGDEAMLLSLSLKNTTIIVSENRVEGILKAKELGCKLVFLDDGYSKHNIEKFDILIRPKKEPTNIFCLPSGGYRDTKMMYSFAHCVLKEDEDFKRIVTFKKDNKSIEVLPSNIVLLTAISKPDRLLEYLPEGIKIISYPDHYRFVIQDIEQLQKKYPNYDIITTAKDMVKLKEFNLTGLYLMDLEIIIDAKVFDKINDYIKQFYL